MYGFPWYYYGGSGDANDPNVQALIKSQFIALMKSSNLVPPFFCTMEPNCKEANISVTPGAIGKLNVPNLMYLNIINRWQRANLPDAWVSTVKRKKIVRRMK